MHSGVSISSCCEKEEVHKHNRAVAMEMEEKCAAVQRMCKKQLPMESVITTKVLCARQSDSS